MHAVNYHELLQTYGYAAVFGMIFLESFGLPLPGETILVSASVMAAHGNLRLWPILLLAWVAAVVGDTIGFAIGHFFGSPFLHKYGRYIWITKARLEKIDAFFDRYGSGIVIFARFFAGLRQVNGILAGASDLTLRRFTIYNAIGATLWVGVWGIGVYLVGTYLMDTPLRFWLRAFRTQELNVLAAIIVLCGGIGWLFYQRRKKKNDQ